ncbi:MAG TPA: hypothetical protein VI387_02490, partial [Candidatus Brocadiales bacterium]|nr:hypothetical protein [Candidatus Brocadiales bacterium]
MKNGYKKFTLLTLTVCAFLGSANTLFAAPSAHTCATPTQLTNLLSADATMFKHVFGITTDDKVDIYANEWSVKEERLTNKTTRCTYFTRG